MQKDVVIKFLLKKVIATKIDITVDDKSFKETTEIKNTEVVPQTTDLEEEIELQYHVIQINDNLFSVIFHISGNPQIRELEFPSKFNFEIIAFFNTDEKLPDDFIKSDFAKINAPAIAFPYVRASISNILLNAGYEPLILPTYNFIELNKQKSQ